MTGDGAEAGRVGAGPVGKGAAPPAGHSSSPTAPRKVTTVPRFRSRSDKRLRGVAPWVRTRLRTAPVASGALALLVLVTAWLAAALPRAVDAYATEGLRHDLRTAAPRTTVLDLTVPLGRAAGGEEVAAASLTRKRDRLRALLPAPLRTDPGQSVHGVRTVKRVEGLDRWLPRPDGLSPELVLASPSDLAAHATLRKGRLPAGSAARPEAVVTARTARALGIVPGAVVAVPRRADVTPIAVRITGIVEPRDPAKPYWAVEPLLHTPALATKGTMEVKRYWQAGLLLSPASAPALLQGTGEPEVYWRFPPAVDHLTGRDAERLADALDSAVAGPALLKLREVMGENGTLATRLDTVVDSSAATRSAISAVVTVAVLGTGTVAAVVLAMTGGLLAARRDAELALLRSRGASLTGLGLRLLGETAAVAVPAAAVGLVLAVLTVGAPDPAGALPLAPPVLAATAVALLTSLALPVRALAAHRRPRVHGGRADLVSARPSRRRTTAELTVLVLAAAAVTSLRLRGADGSGDLLTSTAPVLVGLIAALVLVRAYPLPLRWAARPARRLRGVVGPLALARAGRSSTMNVLPLLALVLALTTAAFGGSVLAGVADARDRAALRATGADARVDAAAAWTPLPDGLTEAVRRTAGVREVAPVQIEYGVELPSFRGVSAPPMSAPLVGVEPASYSGLAERTGFGPFPAGLLAPTGTGGPEAAADTSRVLPAVASPAVAERFGGEALPVVSAAGVFRVKVVAVRTATPALSEADFLLVNTADLTRPEPTTLLVTGPVEAAPLRATVRARSGALLVSLRTEERAGYVDSPLQAGAERICRTAIGAGAGFAVVAVLLSLAQSARERTVLLARLRTMGLTRRQGRRLVGLEALPQAALAAAGGVLAGWASVPLLAPGIDLFRLALAAEPGFAPLDGAPLRVDPWSLLLPALAVVLLTAATAAGQAWWAGRTNSVKELRAGDAR